MDGVGNACQDDLPDGAVDAPVVVVLPGTGRKSWCPDFAIFSVSGHDVWTDSPRNPEYLSREYQTPQAIGDALAWRYGATYEVFAYADELYSDGSQGGFLELLADLDSVRADCVSGFDDATRIIVVAHSHGTVWAHIAVFESPAVPVDVLVDLDGTALGWETEPAGEFAWFGDEWQSGLYEYSLANGRNWFLGTPWYADNYWAVPGVTVNVGYDIEDIVPNNVLIDLEVWSAQSILPPLPRDLDYNYREDGSRTGIGGPFLSGENHSNVPIAGTDAMQWVTGSIVDAYE